MRTAALATVIPSRQLVASRLSRLASLVPEDLYLLEVAERDQRRSPARRELIREGHPIRKPRAVIGGWACHQRILSDGRRQIFGFLLPGDFIGICRHAEPLAPTTIVAVNEVITCPAPMAPPSSALAEAYAASAALQEHYLFAQIMRLGRLNAYERVADWLLEINERLALVDLSVGGQFMLPITQEMLADTLGLTSVHVNRTLQAMRKDGLLRLHRGQIILPDLDRLKRLVDYEPARISAAG